MLNKMPTPSMGGGGATSADKIICLDADGNQSDVQTQLYGLYEKTYSNVPKRVGTWVDGRPVMEVRVAKENDSIETNSWRKRFVFSDLLNGGKTDLILTYMGIKGMYNTSGQWIDLNCMASELQSNNSSFAPFCVKFEDTNLAVAFLDVEASATWYTKAHIDLVIQYVPLSA